MGHKKGDTDCFGSAFGLALGLAKLGKDTRVIAPNEFPDSLNYLFFYFNGEIVNNIDKCDLLIITDSSDFSRISDPELAQKLKDNGAKVVLLDHHTRGDLTEFVDSYIIDATASSASELSYYLLETLGVEIDKNIATCLLAGIIGDTTSFQNQNTTEKTFAASSELMKHGARLNNIVNNTFGNKEVDVLRVWGLAMERLKTDKEHGIVSTYLTYDDISNYGLSADATSGIVNFINSIKGAKVVMLITEEEKGIIKVSLRTRDEYANVANLARQLGGGGHIKAAAFAFPGSLKRLTEQDKNNIVVI
jgi:phosphoesterase RecJ-like protein